VLLSTRNVTAGACVIWRPETGPGSCLGCCAPRIARPRVKLLKEFRKIGRADPDAWSAYSSLTTLSSRVQLTPRNFSSDEYFNALLTRFTRARAIAFAATGTDGRLRVDVLFKRETLLLDVVTIRFERVGCTRLAMSVLRNSSSLRPASIRKNRGCVIRAVTHAHFLCE